MKQIVTDLPRYVFKEKEVIAIYHMRKLDNKTWLDHYSQIKHLLTSSTNYRTLNITF